MWEPLTLFPLLVLLQGTAEVSSSEKSAKDTFAAWRQYQQECERSMAEEPAPTGLVCNRTFDMYACWGDALPNTTAIVPCPWYLPWHHRVPDGFVMRLCGPAGQWLMDESGLPWRDHSRCEDRSTDHFFQKQVRLLEQFRLMYTVGYSLSLVSLLLALLLLLAFRKLRCTRNYIHVNLFLSFMLRAISILTRDALLRVHISKDLQHEGDLSHLLGDDQAAAGCRLAQVLTQYCVGANYYWLLVEGLYLHNLLVLMAISEESCFVGYLLVGWGVPILFVIPWVIIRYLYENNQCWERNDNMAYWWIIRCPILIAILVNFIIFVRIIKILVSKLRAHQMRYTDYKFRLAKSTLTLIPLLGIHEVVFALVTEEQAQGTLRYIKLFFELFLSSFQGLLVSILYCFVNKEVQSEIRRKWQRCRLGANLLEKHGQSCSHGPSCRCQHSKPSEVGCPRRPSHLGKRGAEADSNCSSENSTGGPQPQQQRCPYAGAAGSKSYCYIPVQTQPVGRMGGKELLSSTREPGGNKISESCC
ncbi:gastric inhibitory polypeptide receptor [Emydura macquarii macquarii]|uniref:gastric inhibitory polypeptide receptor n=1 Tax=Emydura macquarii macquarii TaxID=1129001 RepID=UPI00352A648C